MKAILSMIGSATIYWLAFSGSNYLFSLIPKVNDVAVERKRHDLALEQMAQAKQAWKQNCAHVLDFLNEHMKQERIR